MSLPTNFFIGRGGGLQPVGNFDDYGIASGDIQGVSRVFDGGSVSIGTGANAINTAMFANTGSSTDPLKSLLVTSSSGTSNFRPIGFHPTSSYNWNTVSSMNHITSYTFPTASASEASYDSQIGGAHYTDSTSTKVLCHAFQYIQPATSDYTNDTYTVRKNASNDALLTGSYSTPFAQNSSQRFASCIHGSQNTFVQVGKDQSGTVSGFSGNGGQPSYSYYRQLTNNGGIGSETDTQYHYYNTGHNTHGHVDRGVFLGGRSNGGIMYSYFFMNYNNHSGGADGYQFVKCEQTISSGAFSVSKSAHQDDSNAWTVGGSHGRIYMGSQVYPHAFWSIAQEAYNQSNAGAVTDTYYADLSQTWNNSTGFTKYQVDTNGNMKYVSRVGGTTSDPVFAMYEASALKIKSFNTSNRTWTNIASISITDAGRTNGIWPIPNSKRLLVSKQEGFELYELS